MNKLKAISKGVISYVKKNKSGILIGLGITGMATGTYMAADAAYKNKNKLDKIFDKSNNMPTGERVKGVCKIFGWSAGIELVSGALILKGHSKDVQMIGGLTSEVIFAKDTIQKYQQYVKNEIGEKKEQDIRRKVAADQMREHPPVPAQIIQTGSGNFLFFEPMSKLYFRSTIVEVEKALVNLNQELTNGTFATVPLQVYLDFLMKDKAKIVDDGMSKGWNCNDIGPNNLIEVFHDNWVWSDEFQEPVGILAYKYGKEPHTGYELIM